jgi:hypothetical protein
MGCGVPLRVSVISVRLNAWELKASTILAIYWLARAGVYHRDISVGNLGWAARKDGICVGIPFDFDHARLIDKDGLPSSKHITGTIAFMSVDLLADMTRPHIVRYDYESCFWVAWYIATCYKGGKQLHTVKDHPLLSWLTRPLSSIRSAKLELLLFAASSPPPGFGAEFPDPTLAKIRRFVGAAFRESSACDLDGPQDSRWKTMNHTFTRKLLSEAVSGFKGTEKRHGTSFLDKLEAQLDEEDNLL